MKYVCNVCGWEYDEEEAGVKTLADASRAEFTKLEQGDEENLALWKRFIEISIGEFERMYAKLGVKFDTYRGESYYNAMMPGVVDKLLKAGLAEAGKLTGYAGAERCATALLKKGVQRVVLSLGAEGLLAAEGDEMFRLPALTEKTVNDLGAGEAMTAALAVALLREMDLATAAKFAAAAGALVCQSREAFSPALERLRGIAEPKRK